MKILVLHLDPAKRDELAESLREDGHEPRVAALTGLRLDPYFSATKLAWIDGTLVAVTTAAIKGLSPDAGAVAELRRRHPGTILAAGAAGPVTVPFSATSVTGSIGAFARCASTTIRRAGASTPSAAPPPSVSLGEGRRKIYLSPRTARTGSRRRCVTLSASATSILTKC